MKALRKLLAYPARWRRSHGFGVHSPFAYHFITKVLREKDAEYYAYAEIAAFCPKARRAGFNEIFAGKDMSIPEAHMLFRVLCHFNPSEVIEIGHGHEVTNIILERAVPKAKITMWNPGRDTAITSAEPFILVNLIPNGEADAVAAMVSRCLGKGNAIIVVRNIRTSTVSRQLWNSILDGTSFGMGFCDGYTGVFVGRNSLPRQNFDIIL